MQQRAALRELVLNDLYFLAKYIMGFWWLCWEPHKAFATEIEKDENMSLYLLPRGHCKTLLFNTADTIRHYLRAPSEPIAIFCDQNKKAKWKLRPIRHHLTNNQMLQDLFPDLLWKAPKRQAPKWTDEELILPKHPGGQEPSIGIYGLDSQPTSLHFRRIKGDDLVTPETVTTATQIKKNIESYGMVRSSILQGAGGNIQVCGTIYDDGDLHRLMEDSGEYKTYKRPAEYTTTDDAGVRKKRTLWPVQFDFQALAKLQRDPAVGHYLYSCQYLLDPVPEDSNAYFQLPWFPRYDRLPANLNMFAAADLAISEAETACDSAIVVCGISPGYDLYVVHVRKGHWNSLDIIDNIIDIHARYKPGLFTIEAENIARTIKPFLKLKMRETGFFPNVKYYLPMGDKVAKARPLQGRAREGAVLLPAKGPKAPDWLFDTEFQIRRFPKGKEKDIVDSMSLLCHQLADHWRPATPEETEARGNDEYTPLDAAVGM
jgi:predicted phage terminase large subunit-like protein